MKLDCYQYQYERNASKNTIINVKFATIHYVESSFFSRIIRIALGEMWNKHSVCSLKEWMFLHFPFHFTMQRIILFSISHFQQLCWHFEVKTAFDLLMPDLKALWEQSLENGYKWDFGGQKNKTLLFLSFCWCYLCTHVRAIEPHFCLYF